MSNLLTASQNLSFGIKAVAPEESLTNTDLPTTLTSTALSHNSVPHYCSLVVFSDFFS